MRNKYVIFILSICLVTLFCSCKNSKKTDKETSFQTESTEKKYVQAMEVEEINPYKRIFVELVYDDENTIIEKSDFIAEIEIIEEKEYGFEHHVGNSISTTIYYDIFTVKINDILYSKSGEYIPGDTIKIGNAFCSNFWMTGAKKMNVGNKYVVFAKEYKDLPDIKYSDYADYFVIQPWMAIVSKTNETYTFDNVFSSLQNGYDNKLVRKDNGWETVEYQKGNGFIEDLEELIKTKKEILKNE